MTNKTDVMRGEFDVWAVENRLSLNDRLYGAVVWNAALQSPAVRELVEAANRIAVYADDEYVPNMTFARLIQALANFASIKGDKA